MAEPTGLRAEALSTERVDLDWLYTSVPAQQIQVYRSIDGVSYTLIATVAVGIVVYSNTGLSANTRYWFKVSESLGVTFSNIVTVVTHKCDPPPASQAALALPRADEEVTPQDFNALVDQVEMRDRESSTFDPCLVCVVNGAIVMDCSFGCTAFETIITEDINSIALLNCGNVRDITGEFIIPPGTCRFLCGWPSELRYYGDECSPETECIPGGDRGRTVDLLGYSRDGYGHHDRSEPGPCPCIPGPGNALTVKCCSADCIFNCGDTIQLKACGGLPPYSWTATGGVRVLPPIGQIVNVTNGGDGGTPLQAAWYQVKIQTIQTQGTAVCTGFFATISISDLGFSYNCDGSLGAGIFIADKTSVSQYKRWPANAPIDCNLISTVATGTFSLLNFDSFLAHVTADLTISIPSKSFGPFQWQIPDGTDAREVGELIDVRTQALKDAGCNPCIAGEPVIVTVTDAVGVSASIVL